MGHIIDPRLEGQPHAHICFPKGEALGNPCSIYPSTHEYAEKERSSVETLHFCLKWWARLRNKLRLKCLLFLYPNIRVWQWITCLITRTECGILHGPLGSKLDVPWSSDQVRKGSQLLQGMFQYPWAWSFPHGCTEIFLKCPSNQKIIFYWEFQYNTSKPNETQNHLILSNTKLYKFLVFLLLSLRMFSHLHEIKASVRPFWMRLLPQVTQESNLSEIPKWNLSFSTKRI